MPGRPEQHAPEARRHDAVGEILGEAFDGRAGDAGLIESACVAADDLRHRLAPGFEPARIKRLGHGRDMLIKAPLRDERACQACEDHKRNRPGSCNNVYCNARAGSTLAASNAASAIIPLSRRFSSGMLG